MSKENYKDKKESSGYSGYALASALSSIGISGNGRVFALPPSGPPEIEDWERKLFKDALEERAKRKY